MYENQWEKFFELVDKIVNMEAMSADEKAALLRAKAKEYDSETDLSEMCSWVEN